MLLKVKGLKLSRPIHQFDEKPKHLSTLGEVAWPEGVKKVIAGLFSAIGVEDPYRQKLVEPYALAFDGRNNDGDYDLEDVNWEMLIDYFRWEASAWSRNSDGDEQHDALVQEIKDKWGGMFNHQFVYSDGKTWY
jgi:hypothetical protein